jgi:hypothetical protein
MTITERFFIFCLFVSIVLNDILVADMCDKLDRQTKLLKEVHQMDCTSAIRNWNSVRGEQIKLESGK